MTQRNSIVRIAAASFVASAFAGASSAAIIVRNSTTPANNTGAQSQWLADCGAPIAFTIDFETGFTSGQNVSGVLGLFPGGVVFRDTSAAASAVVWSGSFGGSAPAGTFGLRHNEAPFLRIEFPPPGVDGVSFLDIDHTGTTVTVTHADATTSTFTLDTTGSGGAIGEFTGIFRNDRAPIVRIDMDASGDGTWGIDNVAVVGGANCDSIDFNSDGLFPDTADIDDFLSVFSGGPCSTGTCGDIDFNNDGLFPDTTDIDSLLSVFSGGACM